MRKGHPPAGARGLVAPVVGEIQGLKGRLAKVEAELDHLPLSEVLKIIEEERLRRSSGGSTQQPDIDDLDFSDPETQKPAEGEPGRALAKAKAC